MLFKRIEVENFLSFDKAEFDVTDGLLLVSGVNGSGKSSFFVDSISYCLTGTTMKGDRGDDIVNWHRGKDCKVSVTFDNCGHIYRVDRHRSYSGVDSKGVSLGNRLVYYRDDVLVEKSTVAATQDALLEEVNIDVDLLKCTLLLSQDSKFNFVDSTDKRQKEILSKIRRVDFDDAQKKVKAKILDLEKEMSSLDSKEAILISHLVSNEKLDEMKAKSDGFDEEVKLELKEIKAEMTEKMAKMKLLSVGLIAEDPEELESLKRKETAERDCYDDYREKMSKLNLMIKTAISEIAATERIGASCDGCGQDVSDEYKNEIIEKKKKRVELLTKKYTEVLAASIDVKSRLVKIEGEISALKEEKIASDKKQIEVKNLMSEIRRLKTAMESVSERENVYSSKYAETVSMQKQINGKLKEIKKRKKEIEAELPYYVFWQRGFGDKGVKSFIFDTICGTLTTKANKFINFLTNGDISISFDTQSELKDGSLREKFECCITKDGRKVAYSRYSGGEKRRVSLAVDMALYEIMSEFYGTKFNLLVLDEQSNYIDTEGKSEYFKLAKELAKDKCVIIIDHDSLLKSKFDKTVVISKRDGISSLEVA